MGRKRKRERIAKMGVKPRGLVDPVADKTQWKPNAHGGYSWRSFKVIQRSPDRLKLVFTSAVFGTLAVRLLLFGGICGLILVAVRPFDLDAGRVVASIVLLSIPALSLAFTVYSLTLTLMPRIIDRKRGFYWWRFLPPNPEAPTDSRKHVVRIEDIHAIQLISETCRDKTSHPWYQSHELNFVLQDGERIFIDDHSEANAMRSDAQRIATFLEIPVWDAIVERVPEKLLRRREG